MNLLIQIVGPSGRHSRTVGVRHDGSSFCFELDGQPVAASAVQIDRHTFSVLLNGRSYELRIAPSVTGALTIRSGVHEFAAEIVDPRAWRGRRHASVDAEGRQEVLAPMPGKIIRLLVDPGQQVESGQGLIVVEAMKMQNEIRSPKAGKIEKILAKVGQAVNPGEVLVWVD